MRITFWCGFYRGKPYVRKSHDAHTTEDRPVKELVLYLTAEEAMKRFKDVRHVELKVLAPRRTGRGKRK